MLKSTIGMAVLLAALCGCERPIDRIRIYRSEDGKIIHQSYKSGLTKAECDELDRRDREEGWR